MMVTPEYTELRLEDIPLMNLGKFVLDSMKEHEPNSVALVDGDTDKSYTYQQLINRSELAAAGFQKLGMKKDDVICVVAPNHLDYIVACYAASLLYAIFQPVNPLYTKDDLKKATKECNARYILTTPVLAPKVIEALGDGSGVKVIVFGEFEDCISFESLLDSSNAPYTTQEADPKTSVVALMSSSGTSGFPKAVQLSHYNVTAMITQQRASKLTNSSDSNIIFLPLFHTYGLFVTSATINCIGGKVVLMSKFQPELYMELIQKHRPRFLYVVPPIMVMFAKHPKVSEYDLSSVSAVISGAAPLSNEIETAVKTRLNISQVTQGYGMTEVGMTHLCNSENSRYRSVGKLLPLVETKIVNVETRKTCMVNEEGELWVKGPQVCLGYLNKPDQNAELFTEDGWARTGDIGYEDEDRYFYIVDRLKELIKYKGFQVAPAALEDIILKCEAVADVGVVGIRDEEAGELPRAYVVKKADREITEEEIVSFVAGQVAPHMKLRGGVEFVSVIDRTASGKILRRSLREKARFLARKDK